MLCFLNKNELINLKKGGGENVFHILVYCPDANNSQGWARSKPGARNSIWISQVCGRDPRP